MRDFLVEANDFSAFDPDVMIRFGPLDGEARKAADLIGASLATTEIYLDVTPSPLD